MSPPKPERGDIFWVDLPAEQSVGSEQRGTRPALVVSVDNIHSSLPVCIVVPLTSKVDKANRHFRIAIVETEKIQEPGTDGCTGDSLALTEHIRSISVNRLDPKRVARVKPAALAAVEAGIKYVLGLP